MTRHVGPSVLFNRKIVGSPYSSVVEDHGFETWMSWVSSPLSAFNIFDCPSQSLVLCILKLFLADEKLIRDVLLVKVCHNRSKTTVYNFASCVEVVPIMFVATDEIWQTLQWVFEVKFKKHTYSFRQKLVLYPL